MPTTIYPQIQAFIDYLQFEKRYSQHTILSYCNDLEQFFQFLASQFEAPALSNITAGFVRSWLAEMKSEKISSKTLNRKISTLKSFFKYQMKLGVLSATPMTTIISPRGSKRLPSFVSEADIQGLSDQVVLKNSWQQQTDRLLLNIFYNTGMRLSELVNLGCNQVDVSNSQLKVLGKGNKERIIPISRELIAHIQEYIHCRRETFPGLTNPELLLTNKGKPLYAKYVYLVVRENLGTITTLKRKSPHVLRHTFATHLANNGADLNAVKELLGHSSLAATQIYTHNSIDKLKDVHKKAHPKA